jgi:RsiW-degrading membrane proteinase PrsW (M82 family)
MPREEPPLDRFTRTQARLAATLALTGLVAVFVKQVPLGGQIVLGAPLFEEFLKVGLALLPAAALHVRTLWVRLPLALAVGAGFGALEHWLSYPDEGGLVLYGRIAFHALTAGLSMAVLHGLRGADNRLGLACTLPSSFLHAANNTAALWLLLYGVAAGLDDAAAGRLGLAVAGGFLATLALLCATWPLWMAPYRRAVERWLLPRLRPGAAAVSPSTSSRS